MDHVEDKEGMDNYLIFHFTDGSTLRIRYDWLYDFEFTEGRGIIGI